MEIDKMLTVSTAHISAESNDWLARAGSGSEASDIVVYLKADEGYFIYVPERSDFIEKDIPGDIVKCMELACENGCSWLCLDRDGMEVDEFEVYDW